MSVACNTKKDDDEEETTGTGGSSTDGSGAAGGTPGGAGGSSSGAGGSSGSGGTITSQVPRLTSVPEASDEIFRNPERGFYRATDIIAEDTLSWIEDEFSLYHSYVRLDDYREVDIPAPFLTTIDEGLAKVRAEGAKLILRFAYNFGPYPDSEPDASLQRVLGHIEQLGPILQENEDVIATLQAGFIGAWGEWHTSTNGLDNIEDKTTVLEALLGELPSTRAVQVRYPPDLLSIFGEQPLAQSDAWSGSVRSRTGHHNDCFLAGERDTGTYPDDEDPEVFKSYLSQNNLFVPMGGETCAVDPPRSECATALAEMEQLRFSFINVDYHPDVVESWETGGCREEMERSLGYRLRVTEVNVPEAVAPGDPFVLLISLTNDGWAAPINPRPVFVVFEQAGAVYRHHVTDFEVRALLPGQTTTVQVAATLPSSVTVGTLDVGLWLPDAAAALRTDPRYSIRLANSGWNDVTGAHSLGSLAVEEGAPTDSVGDAPELESGWD